MKRERTVLARVAICRKAGCHRPGDYSRGLCAPCYRGLAKLVADGFITWERLIKQGKIEQPKVTLKEWALS